MKRWNKFVQHKGYCSGNNLLQCSKCFKIFKNFKTFEHHQDNINCLQDPHQLHDCHTCFKEFRNQNHLKYQHHHEDKPKQKRNARRWRKTFNILEINQLHKYCYTKVYNKLLEEKEDAPFTVTQIAYKYYEMKFSRGDKSGEEKKAIVATVKRKLIKYPLYRERLLSGQSNLPGAGNKFNEIRSSIENIMIKKFDYERYKHKREVYVSDLADWYYSLINHFQPKGKQITWTMAYGRAKRFMKRNNIVLHKPKGEGLKFAYEYLACLSTRWIHKSQKLMQQFQINDISQIFSLDETHVFHDKAFSQKVLSYQGENDPLLIQENAQGTTIIALWNPNKFSVK